MSESKIKERIHTDNAPAAIGPYSQAIRAANTLYISGCIGIPPGKSDLISNDLNQQTRQALDNLKAIAEAGGASLDSVVKTTVLLADMGLYQQVNAIYAEYFPPDKSPPARAAFAVKGLPKAALVEIDAIAIIQ